MLRRIVKIDEQACTGCGLCVNACHEGAIVMQDGKARLIRDDYCDGLGDCLPACPAGAISFEMREAAAYDEEAVKRHLEARRLASCSGSRPESVVSGGAPAGGVSELRQWPVQIKLAPLEAPYFHGADLLVSADCTAYACGDFHSRFMTGKVTLIGCTKLDEGDYSVKLAEILRRNGVKSVTAVRMDVPCCGGMERAVREAVHKSGRDIPCRVVIIGRDGKVMDAPAPQTGLTPLRMGG